MNASAPSVFSRAITGVLASAVLALTVLTSGCAALSPKTPEEVVSDRINERWNALIAKNFAKAYEYLQPGYRAVISQKTYAGSFGTAGAWKEVRIYTVNCESEKCTARIELTTQNFAPGFAAKIPFIKSFMDETWVKEDGKWWFYQQLPN